MKHLLRMRQILKGGFIMVSIENMTKVQIEDLSFTDAEKKELENARKMAIVFDEDCPETTPEKALKFRRVNPRRNEILKVSLWNIDIDIYHDIYYRCRR